MTTDAAAHQIGDREMASNILAASPRIQVVVTLTAADTEPATHGRQARGPEDVKITPGTTAVVRVTLEERAPITLVMPFLESMFK